MGRQQLPPLGSLTSFFSGKLGEMDSANATVRRSVRIERDRLFAEIRVLKQLKHRNIMTFHDSWLDDGTRGGGGSGGSGSAATEGRMAAGEKAGRPRGRGSTRRRRRRRPHDPARGTATTARRAWRHAR